MTKNKYLTKLFSLAPFLISTIKSDFSFNSPIEVEPYFENPEFSFGDNNGLTYETYFKEEKEEEDKKEREENEPLLLDITGRSFGAFDNNNNGQIQHQDIWDPLDSMSDEEILTQALDQGFISLDDLVSDSTFDVNKHMMISSNENVEDEHRKGGGRIVTLNGVDLSELMFERRAPGAKNKGKGGGKKGKGRLDPSTGLPIVYPAIPWTTVLDNYKSPKKGKGRKVPNFAKMTPKQYGQFMIRNVTKVRVPNSIKYSWQSMVESTFYWKLHKDELIFMLKYNPEQQQEYFKLDMALDEVDKSYVVGPMDSKMMNSLKKQALTRSVFSAVENRKDLEKLGSDLPTPKDFSSLPKRLLFRLDRQPEVKKDQNGKILEKYDVTGRIEGQGFQSKASREAICSFSFSEITCENKLYNRWRKETGQRSAQYRSDAKNWKKRSSYRRQRGRSGPGNSREPEKPLFQQAPPTVYSQAKISDLIESVAEINSLLPAKNIKVLNLNGVKLKTTREDQDLLKDVQNFLCLLPNLEEIRLQNTGLSGALPETFFHCNKKLTFIDLSRNNIHCVAGALNRKDQLKITYVKDIETGEKQAHLRLNYIDLTENPMTHKCTFTLKRPDSPYSYTIANTWDITQMKNSGKTTFREFIDVFKNCIMEEPACEYGGPLPVDLEENSPVDSDFEVVDDNEHVFEIDDMDLSSVGLNFDL